MHILMHHAIPIYEFTEDFEDLGEDAAKQAYPQEIKKDLQVSAVKGFIKNS